MAASRHVAAQHEDWLNLTDAEPPWFSLPAMRRAMPDGLDPTPPHVRAEHKARWHSKNATDPARLASDRRGYIDWLLRDVLGWASHFLTGDQLPAAFRRGRHTPRHHHRTHRRVPAGSARAGGAARPARTRSRVWRTEGAGVRAVLRHRPPAAARRRHLASDMGATRRAVMPPSPGPARAGHRRRPPLPRARTRTRRDRMGHLEGLRIRVRAGAAGLVRVDPALAALHRRSTPEHPRSAACRVGPAPKPRSPTGSAPRFVKPSNFS